MTEDIEEGLYFDECRREVFKLSNTDGKLVGIVPQGKLMEGRTPQDEPLLEEKEYIRRQIEFGNIRKMD